MDKAGTHTKAEVPKKTRPFFNKGFGQGFFRGGEKGGAFFSKSGAGPVQRKLTVGQPNDVYEKEADEVADKVVQRKPIFESRAEPPDDGTVMRKCAHCEKEKD